MPSMDVVFTQILVILLYVVIGFAAGKFGLINPEQRKYLTRICTDLILPFTILSATSQTVSRQDLAGLALITVLILLIFAVTTLIAQRIQTARGTEEGIKVTTTSLLTYPNCTFLGLPLCRALFGEVAVLYNATAMIAFNVLFFTVQSSLFTGKKGSLKNLMTLPMGATVIMVLMLAAGWRFPDSVQTVVSSTGAMISPMTLIIIGVMMSEHRLSAILTERRSYLVTLIRNLVIPLLCMVILRLLPMEPAARVCVLVYLSCPCATLTSIFAIQTGREPEFAARSVLMSTLFFAATLPLIIFLGTRFLA